MDSLFAVRAGAHLGPVFKVESRAKNGRQYEHVLGETPSLTDRIFKDKGSKQIVDFSQSVRLRPELSLYDYRHDNPLPALAKLDHKFVISEYKEMIEEHVERRVLFFFQELIACYKTNLHFESVGAMDQGKSADAIFLIIGGKREPFIVRQAAHSCGNPRLIAYDKTLWDNYESGRSKTKPEGFVYLYGTDLYRLMNSTMSMPKWMNNADREIEEKTLNSLLREIGNTILNKSSQGLITPDEGLNEYIQESLSQVVAAQKRLSNAKKDPEVQEVLRYYKEYLNKFEATINENPKFLDTFLDIKIGDATQSEKSRRIILQMRYAAIRNCRLNQSILMQKIAKLKEEILADCKGEEKRKPDHFDAAFNTLLVEQARTSEDRKRVQTLLNFSPANYAAQYTGGAHTKFLNTKQSLSIHLKKIIFVVREILEDMRGFRTIEIQERSRSIKTLRGMKGWTQRDLGRELAIIYPNAAASQSTICRIERDVKLVTERIAKEFSHVFGVDQGLFMPFFY